MTVLIRPAVAGDAAAAGQAGYAAWVKGIAPIVPVEARKRISEKDFALFVREQPGQILIAERHGEFAGLGATEHGGNYVSDIWVAPKHEGHGTGTALLRALETRIAARGYENATISVLSENHRALTLYCRLGYRPVSEDLEFDAALGCELRKTVLEKSLALHLA